MTEFNYPLKTTFVYLFGGRSYLLEYLGRGGYQILNTFFFRRIQMESHLYKFIVVVGYWTILKMNF